MKPGIGRYQTATQVKVLSPVITNIKEVDSVHLLEDSRIYRDTVSDKSLFRGLSPWYNIARKLRELGRTMSFPAEASNKLKRQGRGMAIW